MFGVEIPIVVWFGVEIPIVVRDVGGAGIVGGVTIEIPIVVGIGVQMSSRKRSQSKPYWKRRAPEHPGYVTRYGFDEDGKPVFDENGQQLYRIEGNRKLRRMAQADARRNKG